MQDHEISESLERICSPVRSARPLATASFYIKIEFADGPGRHSTFISELFREADRNDVNRLAKEPQTKQHGAWSSQLLGTQIKRKEDSGGSLNREGLVGGATIEI